MKVTYLGHSCLLLQTKNGMTILVDPYNEAPGYPIRNFKADVVVMTHEHFDHNHVAMAEGAPKVIRGLADEGKSHAGVAASYNGVSFTSFPVYHDETKGSERGLASMMLIEAHGLRLLHAGDLGHMIDDATARAIGRVDVLCVPVGGFYTMDLATVDRVIEKLAPRVVIPMHYKCEVNPDWPIGDCQAFLRDRQNVKDAGHVADLTALPAQREIWRMDWQ
ncbi:MAG: MBL fold metallo-hydrolase [Armatimonadetes bacterium]|nr:MBL fold metallo-hydrolase [Armatimonadota bacterium]